jgi:hypothetical protein
MLFDSQIYAQVIVLGQSQVSLNVSTSPFLKVRYDCLMVFIVSVFANLPRFMLLNGNRQRLPSSFPLKSLLQSTLASFKNSCWMLQRRRSLCTPPNQLHPTIWSCICDSVGNFAMFSPAVFHQFCKPYSVRLSRFPPGNDVSHGQRIPCTCMVLHKHAHQLFQ